MTTPAPSPLLLDLIRITQESAREIMAVYASDFAVVTKSDLSPVTEADARAEKVILAGLARHFPQTPVLSEEAAALGQSPTSLGQSFFLVDPLDGTKEFVSRNGEFTVNIAKIEDGRPVAGVVYAPAIGDMYWGDEWGGAAHARLAADAPLADARWTKIKVRPAPGEGLTVVASRSHMDADTEAYLAKRNVRQLTSAGSSLKFCLVAAGTADLYPRFGRTMEWDTAAGQAVLEAAGGKVLQTDGAPLRYGKSWRGFDNPAFIASA
jgi:3'(2'), 5'-bisphosphate nucleotidase